MTDAKGREVARIALGELVALAQREPGIATDFRGAAVVLPAARYLRRAPTHIDTEDALDLTRIIHAEYMQRREQPYGPTYCVSLRDATVFGQGSVVTGGGALLIDSCWEFFSQSGLPPGLVKLDKPGHFQLRDHPSRRIDRPTLLVKRPFWHNYGHWLLDGASLLAMIPALSLPPDGQIIIGAHEVPKMRAIMREALDMLAPGIPVIEQPDDETWSVDTLLYVTPPQISPLTKHPVAMATLRSRVWGAENTGHPSRRLFVARDAAVGRGLANQDEVIALCRQLGFEVVHPEQHSLRDQAALFQSASCIVGVKGAAMTNAVFCTNAARLFLLSPADWPDPFFWDLTAQQGIAYGEMFGRLVGDDARQSMRSFAVDVGRLARNLAAFCAPASAQAVSSATA
jgi:capsular polysaccharide biosynthesis protein